MKKRWIKVLFCLVIKLSVVGLLFSEGNTTFVFDPGKIDTGSVYFYQLSTNPDHFKITSEESYYIKSLDNLTTQIEELHTSLNLKRSILETYTMNWKYMMLQSSTWNILFNKEKLGFDRTWKANTTTDFLKKKREYIGTNRMENGFKTTRSQDKFKRIPTFYYMSGHVDLWTVMRFYPYPEKRIIVGNMASGFYTDAEIKYLGKEEVDVPFGRVRTNKFGIKGLGLIAALFGKKAYVWMSDEDSRGYMVKYVNNNHRGNWPMVSLRLVSIKKMTDAEWNTFVDKYREK